MGNNLTMWQWNIANLNSVLVQKYLQTGQPVQLCDVTRESHWRRDSKTSKRLGGGSRRSTTPRGVPLDGSSMSRGTAHDQYEKKWIQASYIYIMETARYRLEGMVGHVSPERSGYLHA